MSQSPSVTLFNYIGLWIFAVKQGLNTTDWPIKVDSRATVSNMCHIHRSKSHDGVPSSRLASSTLSKHCTQPQGSNSRSDGRSSAVSPKGTRYPRHNSSHREPQSSAKRHSTLSWSTLRPEDSISNFCGPTPAVNDKFPVLLLSSAPYGQVSTMVARKSPSSASPSKLALTLSQSRVTKAPSHYLGAAKKRQSRSCTCQVTDRFAGRMCPFEAIEAGHFDLPMSSSQYRFRKPTTEDELYEWEERAPVDAHACGALLTMNRSQISQASRAAGRPRVSRTVYEVEEDEAGNAKCRAEKSRSKISRRK